jgi:outer membrane protein assembly factor BamB
VLLAALAAIAIAAFAGEAPANGKLPLGSRGFYPSPEHPIGWRGDGNGRYPAAEPPLNWGRESKALRELRGQARKPNAGEPGKPMPDAVIREWLVLGPVPIPDGKNAKSDFGPDEASAAPDDGDKSGNLVWKAATTDTSWVNFWPMYNKAVPTAEGVVAYAHAWINSPGGMPVFLNLMSADASRVWLNGKPVGAAGHIKLDLAKGWNRLLVRVAPHLDTGWSKGVIQWHFNAALFGANPGPGEYESRNILWSTPMPDNGPGAGSPIVVGDRVFVLAERGVLVCLGANDGKVLWARATTCADAATEEVKAKNADVFAEIAPMSAKVTDSLQAYCAAPEKYAPDAKLRGERMKAENKINALVMKLDPERFPGQSESEGGEAAATPVSDGEHVYVLFGSGVAACFDLQGNRKWATAVGLKHNEHGYCASPCLIDGKLIVKSSQYLGAVALDAKTGAVATPIPLWKTKGLHSMSTPVELAAGGEKLAVMSFGLLVRVKDGKILAKDFTPPYYNIADYASPTVEGRTICSPVLPKGDGAALRFAFQTLPDLIADPLTMKDTKLCQFDTKAFPTWFSYNQCGSPLLHQGLAYNVSSDAVLTVMDAAKGEVVYQRVLDLNPHMYHGGIIRGGCGSSPTLGGKYIYISDNQGTTVVLEPGRAFKQVARNRVEQLWFRYGFERNECTQSSPVFIGNRLYTRGEVNLYCIGEKDK